MSYADDHVRRQELMRKAPNLVAEVVSQAAKDAHNQAAAGGIAQRVKRMQQTAIYQHIGGLKWS